MTSLAFPPDPQRAQALDANMHRDLGRSLRHVCDACRGALAFDERALDRLIASLAEGTPVSPGTFVAYYALVDAIEAEDPGTAARMFAELAAAGPVQEGTQVVPLDDPALGLDGERYAQLMNADEEQIRLVRPSPQMATEFRTRLASGIKLLDRALPDLSGEIWAIIRQIVICGSDKNMALQFDGGSYSKLWGALFLNGEFHPDDVAVVEVLAHESAHSLLFGFCTDEPLVSNPADAVYPSPLRTDPRPMEGIYHATFVSARMHWAMSRLAEDKMLSGAERDRARAAARADAENFAAGHRVVAEHAQLTGLGAELMQGAKEYMDSVC